MKIFLKYVYHSVLMCKPCFANQQPSIGFITIKNELKIIGFINIGFYNKKMNDDCLISEDNCKIIFMMKERIDMCGKVKIETLKKEAKQHSAPFFLPLWLLEKPVRLVSPKTSFGRCYLNL